MYRKFVILILLLSTIAGHCFSQNHNVLILNSYHSTMEWAENTIKGIQKGFERDKGINLYIEYLDSKRNNYRGYSELFYNYLKNKYHNKEISVIIANDNNALDFLEKYKNSLFPSVPVVLTGINVTRKYPENYTSIQEKIDFWNNLKLIKRIHPDISELYVVSDETITGKLLRKEIIKKLEESEIKISSTFIRDYTLTELKDKISGLEKGSIVFLTVFSKDRKGNYYSFEKVIRELSSVSEVPIYGPWEFYLGKGLTGGKIVSGYQHGKLAANYASRIIKGTDLSELPVKQGPSTYKFDYNQLKKHGISKSQLPEDSVIINEPYDYIYEHKRMFIFIGIVIILLFITIFILIRYNRVKQARIKDQQIYLEKIEKANLKLEKARQEAEKANRLKTSFLANISHEIRTPLNAITGFSKLLVEGKSVSDFDTRKKYVDLIKVNSQILLNLINDIIDLSKIETGQLVLNYSDFDLNQLMKDLEEVTLNELKKKEKSKIDLLVEMDVKKENFFIRSDESRLRQVLNNLIQNAVKFTHKGHIVIGYKVKEKELLFYVKDTGIGIDQADKEIIFERFNQGKDVIRKHMGGTGLGLSISKEIIQRMKGEIWVESEHNKGAEFYFTIPLIDVAEATVSHAGVKENDLAVKYNWSGKRILIVEDSPIAYELLIKLLNITKAEFILAEDGQSAIEKVKKDHNIDLVLMDIQLPYLDGYQTTEKIKEFRPELPVVAQTANAMSDDRKRCLTAGCNDYLAKPIDRQELLEKIDKLLS